MFKISLSLLSAALVLKIAESAPPLGLTKCKADDSKCTIESTKPLIPVFANGIPQYKIEVLDPLKIKSVNASQDNLLFTLTDVTVSGLKNCQPSKIKRDPKKSKLYVNLSCPSLMLDGDYILNGVVLVIPVGGKGKVHVHLKSAVIELNIDLLEKVGDDGERHWNIKSFTHSYDMKEKSDVIFENLNKDNELLRQASADLLRENGNEVIKEIGNPVITAGLTRIVKNINYFFKAESVDNLSLD